MKQLVLRSMLGCALAAVLAMVAAAGAAALTVTPSGAYTASSSGFVSWRAPITGAGAAVCLRSSMSIPALSSTGSGTVPLGGATFTAPCQMVGGDPAIVTQSDAWTVALVLHAFAIDVVVTVPPRGLTITGPRCTLTLGGTITHRVLTSGLPASVQSFSVTRDTLTVDGSSGSGMCLVVFPVGAVVDMQATQTLNAIAVVSG